jgi:8-oxo-dGTP pyrophosphatase MutT (NUDIX family)
LIACAVLLLRDSHNSLLLQKRDPYDWIAYPECWAIPGGSLSDNESPQQAALRECCEEIQPVPEQVQRKAAPVHLATFEDEDRIEFVYSCGPILDSTICIEGAGSRFFAPHELPLGIAPHHLFMLRRLLELDFTDLSSAIFPYQFRLTNGKMTSKETHMSRPTEFVTIGELHKGKDLDLFDQGVGIQSEKNNARTFLYHNGESIHYHLDKIEHMVVINGTLKARYAVPDSDELLEVELGPGSRVRILPGCCHSYLSADGATAVEFSPQKFDRDDQIDVDPLWA